LTWFTIAGADGKFVPAEAVIVGDTVEVSAAGVKDPDAVRFAWDETAQPNFFNGAGLPAEPFRTDNPIK
jgi:sialate O-acetylesterase